MNAMHMERLLDILSRAVAVAERWADKEYPVVNATEAEGVYTAGEQPEPQSEAEYKEFQPGRFEKRFTSPT